MRNLLNRLNHNVTKITESPIRIFDQKISDIPGLIKLTLGEPDFHTPDHVKMAGIKAITDNHSRYAPTPGFPELRQAAVDFVRERYDLNFTSLNETIVTVGASEALFASLQTIINPGDKVLIPAPYFGLYRSMITLLGGEVVEVDVAESDFILKPEHVQEVLDTHGDDLKAVLVNYPMNPTGINWSEEDAKAVAQVLEDKEVFVISDEVYSELIYEGHHVSISKYLPEQTIVINGVSKSHAMTGWRVGLVFAQEPLLQEINKVHQQLVTTINNVSQYAALAALKHGREDAEPMRKAYQERRDYLYQALTELGFDVVKPTGAFYIFAKIPAHLPQVSEDFGLDLATHAKVGIIPGSGFGQAGEGFIRFSYASSMEDLQEAIRRISEYFDRLSPKG